MKHWIKESLTFGVLIALMVGHGGISRGMEAPEWEVPKGATGAMVIPVSDEVLLCKVKEALSETGVRMGTLRKVDLDDYGMVYVSESKEGKRPVLARLVARRVPCGDCHDVFFLYVFDSSRILRFIPVSITKRYNKPWTADDVGKIEKRFIGRDFSEKVPFNPAVDAVTSATMSSKIVFNSLNETRQVYKRLAELGYVSKGH
ncbi:MAG: hypothetical protein JRI36_05855 [Deltaproteobacteria bacterium]|nr:hypothetical protein [Deltaproteobacteria bacterium]